MANPLFGKNWSALINFLVQTQLPTTTTNNRTNALALQKTVIQLFSTEKLEWILNKTYRTAQTLWPGKSAEVHESFRNIHTLLFE